MAKEKQRAAGSLRFTWKMVIKIVCEGSNYCQCNNFVPFLGIKEACCMHVRACMRACMHVALCQLFVDCFVAVDREDNG